MSEPFNFSIYNYDDDNLTAARRINQLEPKDFLTVNIDYKQAPIGTATCGPGVDEKYVLGNQVYEFTVLLRALGIAETDDEILNLLGDSDVVRSTVERDVATTREDALIEIYRRQRIFLTGRKVL